MEVVDDAFDDISEDKIGDRDYNTLKNARFKDGYREGVSKGEDQSAQQGFDFGYENAFAAIREAAIFKGVLTVVLNKINTEDEATEKKSEIISVLTDIIRRVGYVMKLTKEDFASKCDSYYERKSNEDTNITETSAAAQGKTNEICDIEHLKLELNSTLINYGWETSLVNKLFQLE